MSEAHHDGTGLSAGLAVEAAGFDTTFYAGSYQGILPSVGWEHGRFGANATMSLYHLEENGRSVFGMGDAMAAGHATVFAGDTVQTGVALHVMLPTGSELDGLGMGHAMVMPSAWGAWRPSPLTVTASGGYSRAMTSLSGAQHDHGPAPLVDPMNLQELTWSAAAELEVGHGVTAGARTLGAAPIGRGRTRVIGAGRVAWGTPRVSTAFELQLGIAGDPFTIRGVVETALRF
ncbi:MAG TPA: hypothetical protein VFT22_35240 [Kofleriaceae bacterium]|nr:hypothetical protein [Kofleriaceae bacterium]